MSLATWDHTVLPVTQQVNEPRLNPSQRPILHILATEGWKAELT